mmetsp:Transcript_16307/g.41811  ORF Transcript_16307/g.41811 Transcript_16307/m.41811 type:complete len:275 (+) Transcript_16307:2134-2958(+)
MCHVKRESGGRVVEGGDGLRPRLQAVVEDARCVVTRADGQHVLPYNGHAEPRRPKVFPRRRVYAGVPGHIHGPRQQGGRHVGHDVHAVQARVFQQLEPRNRLVGAQVHVRRVGPQAPRAHVGYLGEAVVGGIGNHRGIAVLQRLTTGTVGPEPGVHVVRLGARAQEIQGHSRKLRVRAAVEEEDLVVGGDVQEAAQVGLGSHECALHGPPRVPVAKLHEGHARGVPVEQVALHRFQHFEGKLGRTSGEIVGPFHAIHVQEVRRRVILGGALRGG